MSATNPTIEEKEIIIPMRKELLTEDCIKAGTQSLKIASPKYTKNKTKEITITFDQKEFLKS